MFMVTGGAPGPTWLKVLTSANGTTWTEENTDPTFAFSGGTLDAIGYSPSLGIFIITYNGTNTHVVVGQGAQPVLVPYVSPTYGPMGGGTTVTIQSSDPDAFPDGERFSVQIDNGLRSFGDPSDPDFALIDYRSLEYTRVSGSKLTCVTQARDCGPADVCVLGVSYPTYHSQPNVLFYVPFGYTYTLNPPTITDIVPTSGPSKGGTNLTLFGEFACRSCGYPYDSSDTNPSAALIATPQQGLGLGIGEYQYAFDYIYYAASTGASASESNLSPLVTVQTGPITVSGVFGTPNDPIAGPGPDPGQHYWAISYLTDGGETLAHLIDQGIVTTNVTAPDAGTASTPHDETVAPEDWTHDDAISFAFTATNSAGETLIGDEVTTYLVGFVNDTPQLFWAPLITAPTLPAGDIADGLCLARR